jgi:hypothetical protein
MQCRFRFTNLQRTTIIFVKNYILELQQNNIAIEITRIRDGVGGLRGGWFGECVTRRVGVGSETFFWSDPWLGGIPLYERFGPC